MGAALWNLLFFIVSLGVLVFIHEGGHYLAARWCKVKVYRFSLGFGPVLYKRMMKNGTEFAISAIPMGGYVKMKGENDAKEEVIETDFAQLVSGESNDSFVDKTIGQRALIVAAGPLCNIILAILLYTVINMMGVTSLKSVVGEISDNSIAAQAQMQDYDFVTKIGDTQISDWQAFIAAIVPYIGSSNVPLEVVGNMGEGSHRTLHIDLSSLSIEPNGSLYDDLGFSPCYGYVPERLSFVVKDSAADHAGIKEGDRLLSINGNPIIKWNHVSKFMKSYESGAILIELERDGQVMSVELQPDSNTDDEGHTTYTLGVGMKMEIPPELYKTTYYGPIEALGKALEDTKRMSMMIMHATKGLILGAISTKNIAGPITMASAAGDTASYGFVAFLGFMAALSVNLGVLNLLPIPVLDGGQLMFLAYEKVVGRKPNDKVQLILIALGMSLILSLTMLAIFNDLAALQVKMLSLQRSTLR